MVPLPLDRGKAAIGVSEQRCASAARPPMAAVWSPQRSSSETPCSGLTHGAGEKGLSAAWRF